MEKRDKIALAVIAKDKTDIIERMLDSTQMVFDCYCLQDTGSTDKTIEVFENWCKKNNKDYVVDQKFVGKDYKEVIVDDKVILGDFASARNDSFALIPKDYKWAFWMDTDDILIHAEQVPQLAEFCSKNKVDMAVLTYDYAPTIDGLTPVTQKRERLINLEKKGTWKNYVHETYQILEKANIIFQEQTPFQIKIQHERTPNESLATNRRNNQIMKLQIEEEGMEKIADEVLHNLAYDCWEHKEYEESIKYYLELLKKWTGKQLPTENIYQVYIKIATAFMGLEKFEDGTIYALKAISLIPNYANGYLLLAQLFARLNNWDEVEYYADKVLKIGKPITTAAVNDFDYTIIPLTYKLQAALAKNDLNKGIEMINKLREMMPSNMQFKQQYFNLKGVSTRQQAITAIDILKRYYQENNQSQAFENLRFAIPLELKDDDNVRRIIKETLYDEKHKKLKISFPKDYIKTIVFFAGEGYEIWDGKSDITKGIGGSEGMCIQLARELAALGNKVFVYNSCGESDGKVFEGVTYIDSRKWDPNTKCDIFVSLRRPDIFNRLIKASKLYLWLHDTEYGEVPLSLIYGLNNVIVLSEFHKEIIKANQGITDNKIFWISRNGINKKALEYADKNAGKRHLYRLIYASSYDRGLVNLLQMWPKIKEKVPEATLDIYYGTVTLDRMIQIQAQVNPQVAQNMQMFKSQIFHMISQLEGVRELGRISQNELYKKFKESGIWVYPTQFQEISCITAMTAQAMGALPVCTPFAALNETVNSKYGIKVDLAQYTEALIYQLKHPEEVEEKRESMMKWARNEFSMKELAKEWNNHFNNN